MLDSKGFDKWAGDYDKSIAEMSEGYPFEGYYDVLAGVHSLIEKPTGKRILDIGVGTGLLTNELYKQGSYIYGLDFSEKMINEARIKMPKGLFYNFDMKNGIPVTLENLKFDYIVSSYAMHHLQFDDKLNLIERLKDVLVDEGTIILADISFDKREDMINCKFDSGIDWDDDEEYIVFEEIKSSLLKIGLEAEYSQISKCAGILKLKRNKY